MNASHATGGPALQVNKAEELLQARPQQNEAEQQARIAERPDLPAHLEYGQVVSGVVESLMSYGCIIQFDGVVGLLHISKISHKRVKNVKEVFSVGEAVKASACMLATLFSAGRRAVSFPVGSDP